VDLAGQHAASLSAAGLAVSTPGNVNDSHYLTPAEFRQRYGASAAQAQAVSDWLTGTGMKITAKTSHYIAGSSRARASPDSRPARFTESLASDFASTCGAQQDQPGAQPDPEEETRGFEPRPSRISSLLRDAPGGFAQSLEYHVHAGERAGSRDDVIAHPGDHVGVRPCIGQTDR
jgi:hypothetical protein